MFFYLLDVAGLLGVLVTVVAVVWSDQQKVGKVVVGFQGFVEPAALEEKLELQVAHSEKLELQQVHSEKLELQLVHSWELKTGKILEHCLEETDVWLHFQIQSLQE